jgi:hypothetical protein
MTPPSREVELTIRTMTMPKPSLHNGVKAGIRREAVVWADSLVRMRAGEHAE